MSAPQWLTLVATLFGIVGTSLLFFYSNTDLPYQGATWGGPETAKHNAEIRTKNRVWRQRTKLGYGLLCISFVLQAVSVVVPPSM
jgi:hypothetical protein